MRQPEQTTNCPLTGLERMQVDCQVCMQTIYYFRYNADGQLRNPPTAHSGDCKRARYVMKAIKVLQRRERRLSKQAQAEINFL